MPVIYGGDIYAISGADALQRKMKECMHLFRLLVYCHYFRASRIRVTPDSWYMPTWRPVKYFVPRLRAPGLLI